MCVYLLERRTAVGILSWASYRVLRKNSSLIAHFLPCLSRRHPRVPLSSHYQKKIQAHPTHTRVLFCSDESDTQASISQNFGRAHAAIQQRIMPEWSITRDLTFLEWKRNALIFDPFYVWRSPRAVTLANRNKRMRYRPKIESYIGEWGMNDFNQLCAWEFGNS